MPTTIQHRGDSLSWINLSLAQALSIWTCLSSENEHLTMELSVYDAPPSCLDSHRQSTFIHRVDAQLWYYILPKSIWWRTNLLLKWNMLGNDVRNEYQPLDLSPLFKTKSIFFFRSSNISVFHISDYFNDSRKPHYIARNSIISYLIWVCLARNHFSCYSIYRLPVM